MSFDAMHAALNIKQNELKAKLKMDKLCKQLHGSMKDGFTTGTCTTCCIYLFNAGDMVMVIRHLNSILAQY
jgi:hypothetical protein